jgi:hypothetical protein
MKTPLVLSLALQAVLFAAPAAAGPLRADHPLVGSWTLDLANETESCQEIYRFRADGTSLVTSAQEVAQSRFDIDDKPSAKGFYKMVDTIEKDNGGEDCGGEVTAPGNATTRYLLFSEDQDQFIMCEDESPQACIGPFERIKADANSI